MTKPTLVWLTILLSIFVGACADTNRASNRSPSPTTPSAQAPSVGDPVKSANGYLNDGDNDSFGDADQDNNHDNDHDNSEDHQPDENGQYHDGDERHIVAMGHAAGPAEKRAITALVKRYYAVAARGDGAKACSMIIPSLAKAVAEDYGAGSAGPPYLSTGKTCPAVMALLFEHSRAELRSAKLVITGVRVNGKTAVVLLGSKTVPAASITLQREHGAWMIDELLGSTFS